jgi:ribosomal protein L11 methyltransferase
MAAEAVSAALFEAGAGAVWEDQPDDKGRVVMKSAFPQDQQMKLMADLPGALRQITESMSLALGDFGLILELRPGEDHSESWKKDLKPIAVTDGFIIAPSWWTEPLDGSPDAKVLRLDPGSAFGSGHHPTTFMCLRLLAELAKNSPKPSSILDLGAGSGVLALSAALMLPQAKLTAIDNDPETLFAARSNLSLNNLADKIELLTATLDQIEGPYDLILANLTRNTLIELAKEMARKAAAPAKLIISGLIEEQVSDVVKAFGAQGFSAERHLGLAEWSALLMTNSRRAAPLPARELLQVPGFEEPQSAQVQGSQSQEGQSEKIQAEGGQGEPDIEDSPEPGE